MPLTALLWRLEAFGECVQQSPKEAFRAKLKMLWDQGLTPTQIAARTGKTKNCISAHLCLMGLRRRKRFTPRQVATQNRVIRSLWRSELTKEEIGRRIGLEAGTVGERARKLGLSPRAPGKRGRNNHRPSLPHSRRGEASRSRRPARQDHRAPEGHRDHRDSEAPCAEGCGHRYVDAGPLTRSREQRSGV